MFFVLMQCIESMCASMFKSKMHVCLGAVYECVYTLSLIVYCFIILYYFED